MKRKPYPAYKPSGVEWIGDVPEHWEVKRLKNAFHVYNGSTPESSKEEFWDGDITWYTPEDLGNNARKNILDSRRKITQGGYANIGATIVPKSSIIISTRAPIGHIAITDVPACTNQGCRSLVPKKNVWLDFHYYYLLISKNNLNSIGKGTTFIELGNQGLEGYLVPLPPFPEQQAIADFLDCETGKIDTLIGKNRRLIALLKEKRMALISRAVTKGLDPTVKMKPSGVEWLGDVPEHWKVKKIRRVATRVQTGNTPPTSEEKYYDDGTVPWFGPSSFGEGIFLSEPVKVINKCAVEDGVARLFNAGTVMLVCIGATIGKVSSIKENASCNQQITGVTFRDTLINTEFITFQLKLLETTIREVAPSATLAIFDQNKISDLQLALPPLPEQRAIVDFLDKETGTIDALIAKVEKAIEKLKEYRTALISAAVTGKIDVREAA